MIQNKLESVHKKIGEVALNTSFVHLLAAQIISRYYQGNSYDFRRISFIHDVLINNSASFSFITESLKRVLINMGLGKKYVENIEEKMRKIGNLRNNFAHEIPLVNQILYLRDKKKIPYCGEGKDYDVEFANFKELYNQVCLELKKIIYKSNTKEIKDFPDGYKPPKENFN
jgi:hypothetical protein